MIIDKPYYRNRRDNPNSSVKNPQKVYCMNVEYDHIRDILMDHPETWEKFKYYYTLKKFHNYNATLKRISEEFKMEYLERISEEFKRAKIKEELDMELFTPIEKEKIELLMASPQAYYYTYAMKNAEVARMKKELKQTRKELVATKKELKKAKGLRNSITFKIGKVIMFIPRKIKRLFSR